MLWEQIKWSTSQHASRLYNTPCFPRQFPSDSWERVWKNWIVTCFTSSRHSGRRLKGALYLHTDCWLVLVCILNADWCLFAYWMLIGACLHTDCWLVLVCILNADWCLFAYWMLIGACLHTECWLVLVCILNADWCLFAYWMLIGACLHTDCWLVLVCILIADWCLFAYWLLIGACLHTECWLVSPNLHWFKNIV